MYVEAHLLVMSKFTNAIVADIVKTDLTRTSEKDLKRLLRPIFHF
jgi:hypothetical protein